MSNQPLTSTPMREASSLTRARFAMPAGACDSHVHVFGPAASYPSVDQPHYTLPDGAPALLERLGDALDIERFAIVQPSYYGTDNSCMLDALARLGVRARGVAMVDESIDDGGLALLHAHGVRALRLDLFLRAQWPIAEIAAYVRRSIARVKPMGWHVQFYTPGYVVRDLIPYLDDFETDYVIDHMGYMLESDGLTRADFDRLIAAVRSGRGWMKLSGPYRVAKDGNFERLRPLAQAIVEAVPDRTIWGSDWPHIPMGERDTGELLNLLGDWVPDKAARNRILADNPARLYAFGK
jgi:2-pyrone-4,6-dicarboxylate lactonase